jgi:hypothetical protein
VFGSICGSQPGSDAELDDDNSQVGANDTETKDWGVGSSSGEGESPPASPTKVASGALVSAKSKDPKRIDEAELGLRCMFCFGRSGGDKASSTHRVVPRALWRVACV